jgi:CBS domain containing-hemolysin-like protein
MYTFQIIFIVIVFILLLFFSAISLSGSRLSRFELGRRVKLGDKEAETTIAREDLLNDLVSLQRALVALFLVIFVLISIVTFGWLVGILLSLFVALESGLIAHVGFIKNWSQKLYDHFEKNIINFIKKTPYLFKLSRSMPIIDCDDGKSIASRQELQHIIDESEGVLTLDEKSLIVHSLSFGDRLVDSVMTPKSMINSVNGTEFLGPLTLDDLHKTGHSRLPVIKGDINHVIGILNLQSLLALDVKRSTTAEKAMEPKVFYIRQDQTLQHALSAFLRTKHHLFIVVNEFRETVGLLSLEDVIEALLGRKIVDEFNDHDNLREVAMRNPHNNNHPEKREDV